MRPNILAPRLLAAAAAVALTLSSPAVSSAQSELDVSEAQAFLGAWVVSIDSDFGPFSMDLEIADQGGKVAANVGSPDLGTQEVTNITRDGEQLVLAWDADAQGQVVDIMMSLQPDGEDLATTFEAAGGQFYAQGVATRSAN
jgi:hypothetical protein